MSIQEVFRSVIHITLDCLEDLTQFHCDLIHRYHDLLTIITTNNDNLILLNILRSDLDTCRDTKHLLLREFPSRTLLRIINLHSVSGFLKFSKQFICFVKHAFLVLSNRNHTTFNRCKMRW